MFNKRRYLFLILGFIVFLAFLNPIISSSFPDGLEKVAEDKNFMSQARNSFSIFGDYLLPFDNKLIAGGAAGLLGVIISYILLLKIGKLLSKN